MSLAEVHIHDAKARSHDPGRTATLRKGFRAAADMQLNQLRASLRQAVIDYNVLGLSGGPSNYSFMASGVRLNQFAGWLENAANAALDARWWVHPWLDKATQHGLNSAQQEMQGVEFQPIPTTFSSLHELARHELRGIIGVLVQKVVRQAHSAATRRLAPHQAYRELVQPIDGDIKNRLQLFAQHFGQKGHIHGKAAYYQQAGVRQFGINPELRGIRRKVDQRSSSGRHRHRTLDAEPADTTWVTADDDLVCDECEEMAMGSPYVLEEVMDLIPLHPNCRCDLTTYDGPEEFDDSLTIDFDPSEERDEHGQWTTGGGGKQSTIEDFEKDKVDVPASVKRDPVKAAEFIKDWNAHIKVSPAEFKREFTGGIDATMQVADFKSDWKITGVIKGEDGADIGDYTRTIYWERNSAASDFFELKGQSTGHDIGKHLLAGNVAMYQQLGLDKVMTHANIDVGGYAWAKYGYVPTPLAWSILAPSIRNKLKTWYADSTTPVIASLIKLTESDDPKALWAISDSSIGKQLLLGEDWLGYLDLHDKETMTRFHAYVAKTHGH